MRRGDDLALLKADIFKLQGIFVFDKRQRKSGRGRCEVTLSKVEAGRRRQKKKK